MLMMLSEQGALRFGLITLVRQLFGTLSAMGGGLCLELFTQVQLSLHNLSGVTDFGSCVVRLLMLSAMSGGSGPAVSGANLEVCP
jgi:hypothetical protein